jgi:hypothetical protein
MRDIWVDGAGQSRTIPDKSAKKVAAGAKSYPQGQIEF